MSRNRIHLACTQTVSPWHGKDHYDTKWSFAIFFSLLISLDSVWFVVGCFEGFFSPSMPGASPLPNLATLCHTEDAPYLTAENRITEASPEELASCSLAFHKVAVRGLKMTKPFKPQVNDGKQRKGIRVRYIICTWYPKQQVLNGCLVKQPFPKQRSGIIQLKQLFINRCFRFQVHIDNMIILYYIDVYISTDHIYTHTQPLI